MKRKVIKCKYCGYSWKPNEVEPQKTWHLVAPFPDKEGKITITVMAIWVCPKCGRKVKGVYSKIKVGDDADISSKNRTKMLLETLNNIESINLDELAKKFSVSKETIIRALEYLIKTGKIKGKIENNYFIKVES